MSLVVIETSYNWADKLVETEEARKILPEWFTDTGNPKASWECKQAIIEIEDLQKLLDLNVKVEVKKFAGFKEKVFAEPNVTHVHLPNFALLSFNKVEHLDDCCTDRLQEMLDKGWRIIAICPPLNARRPDYIVGRVE